MNRSRQGDIYGFVGTFLLVAAAAGIGSLFSYDGSSDWYQSLTKPLWTPPSWVFGPVWTVLYVLMALSGGLVWLRRDRAVVWPALAIFVAQLVLNALWSVLFFGLHRPGLALLDVMLLLLAIVVNVAMFWRIRRLAGLLLIPYMAWTGLATVLNFVIWRLNA